MAHAVPSQIIQEVEKILANSTPVNQRLTDVIALLTKHGFCQMQTLKPNQMLTHPENRGGSMVSYHDAWAKGAQLVSVGVQPQLLHGSICFQLSTQEAIRQQQLQKNKDMAQDSSGHLAPLSGQEGCISWISTCFLSFSYISIKECYFFPKLKIF